MELWEETGVQRRLTGGLVTSKLQDRKCRYWMAYDRIPKRAAGLREEGRRR